MFNISKLQNFKAIVCVILETMILHLVHYNLVSTQALKSCLYFYFKYQKNYSNLSFNFYYFYCCCLRFDIHYLLNDKL